MAESSEIVNWGVISSKIYFSELNSPQLVMYNSVNGGAQGTVQGSHRSYIHIGGVNLLRPHQDNGNQQI